MIRYAICPNYRTHLHDTNRINIHMTAGEARNVLDMMNYQVEHFDWDDYMLSTFRIILQQALTEVDTLVTPNAEEGLDELYSEDTPLEIPVNAPPDPRMTWTDASSNLFFASDSRYIIQDGDEEQ